MFDVKVFGTLLSYHYKLSNNLSNALSINNGMVVVCWIMTGIVWFEVLVGYVSCVMAGDRCRFVPRFHGSTV